MLQSPHRLRNDLKCVEWNVIQYNSEKKSFLAWLTEISVIRMKIIDDITSRLLLILSAIFVHIKFQKILQPLSQE